MGKVAIWCSGLWTYYKKNLGWPWQNVNLQYSSVSAVQYKFMFPLEVKSFVRKLKEEKKKESIQRQENAWNRFDNSVKAFALMLICATMRRLLARTQTLLFIFVRVILWGIFIWKRLNGHFHSFSKTTRIKGSTLKIDKFEKD